MWEDCELCLDCSAGNKSFQSTHCTGQRWQTEWPQETSRWTSLLRVLQTEIHVTASCVLCNVHLEILNPYCSVVPTLATGLNHLNYYLMILLSHHFVITTCRTQGNSILRLCRTQLSCQIQSKSIQWLSWTGGGGILTGRHDQPKMSFHCALHAKNT